MLPLIDSVVHQANPGATALMQEEDVVCGQMSKPYGPDFGLSVYGEFANNYVFNPEYYFPYHISNILSTREVVTVERFCDRNAYGGMCEDLTLGVSLIFYLVNGLEYAKRSAILKEPARIFGVRLSALSLGGVILLPVAKREGRAASMASVKARTKLMEAARNGDEDALENLALEDMNLAQEIGERSVHEDIYSIVDTSFMPCGLESDQYSIVGVIESWELVKNNLIDEDLYRIIVQCNDLRFSVLINCYDLLGAPEIGRRFKGDIWLQGYAEFEPRA